jgi:hypothetical protein
MLTKTGGSILLAHNPPKWVNFARRFTARRDLTLSGYAALALTGDILDAFGLYLPMPDRSPVPEETATGSAERVPPEEKVVIASSDVADK